MNKKKQDNDTKRKYYIKRMIDSVRKDLAALSKEWSHEELVRIDPRLSDDKKRVKRLEEKSEEDNQGIKDTDGSSIL